MDGNDLQMFEGRDMMLLGAQRDGRNPDNAEFLRQPHKGPQTYIGVMFAVLSAKSGKFPTRCAD